jgi:leucyl/phenylalanyl-tRNA--protein transferase
MIPPAMLIEFYLNGDFPMADRNGDIGIYHPDQRGVIELDRFHVPDTLRKLMQTGKFVLRFDTAFKRVMEACADRRDTWISSELIESYCALHDLGFAHSVVVWLDDKLACGLYGVAIGGAFFGESMFHDVRDASKVALAALVGIMKKNCMTLLDTQYTTAHLEKFGAVEIPDREYMKRLKKATHSTASFVPIPMEFRLV